MSFDFELSSNLNYNSSYFSNFGVNNFTTSPNNQKQASLERDDLFFSDDEENDPKPRLPLFGRCPLTNRAFLDTTPPTRKPLKSASSPYSAANSPYTPSKLSYPTKSAYSPAKSPYSTYSPVKASYSPAKANMSPYYRGEDKGNSQEDEIFARNRHLLDVSSRMPLLQISNRQNFEKIRISPKKISWSQVARKPASDQNVNRTPPGFSPTVMQNARNVSTNLFPCSPTEDRENKKKSTSAITQLKPSLDEVQDDSLVAMTNKHGKGKYWFKSGCPTPDPRWPARQQLMIGPIPGDVEYATLRSAFLSKGHTIHLFIQNNQAWLEKNQEKFGKKQVKFGYVVYTEPEVARRLYTQGHVMVGHARVAVKEMDGQPALFNN